MTDLATWALYLAWAVLLVALPWAWISNIRREKRVAEVRRNALECYWIAQDEDVPTPEPYPDPTSHPLGTMTQTDAPPAVQSETTRTAAPSLHPRFAFRLPATPYQEWRYRHLPDWWLRLFPIRSRVVGAKEFMAWTDANPRPWRRRIERKMAKLRADEEAVSALTAAAREIAGTAPDREPAPDTEREPLA